MFKNEESMILQMFWKVFYNIHHKKFLKFSQGIGFIEKNHKNKIKWIGSNEDSTLKSEIKDLNREYEKLCAEDKLLEYWIEKTNEDLQSFGEDELQSHYAFLTYEDLQNLRNLSNTQEDFLIIKAPKGTTLERVVLDENEENDYPHQIFLDSGKEEIIPFILSNEHVSLDYK